MNHEQIGYRVVMFIAVTLMVAGCDDTGGIGNGNPAGQVDCSPVTACGGDVTGSWVYLGFCGATLCAGATYDYSMSNVTLTLAGGKAEYSLAGSEKTSYPLSCLQVDGGLPLSCPMLGTSPGVSCQVANNRCDCTLDLSKVTFPGFTYTTVGGKFTVTGPSGASPPTDYCVVGDRLRFSSGGIALAMTGQNAVSEWVRKK